MKEWIVNSTKGYCGADLKAFCTEASVVALRRTFPQVYESDHRLVLDHSLLSLKRGDFAAALNKIVASSSRSINVLGRPLVDTLLPLLQTYVDDVTQRLEVIFPAGSAIVSKDRRGSTASGLTVCEDSDEWIAALADFDPSGSSTTSSSSGNIDKENFINDSWLWDARSINNLPRLMLLSRFGWGHEDIVGAVIHHFESVPCVHIDIPSLVSDCQSSCPEQALVSKVQDAVKQAPSIVYLPDVRSWWRSATEPLKNTLLSIIRGISRAVPVLWLSTVIEDSEPITRDVTISQTDDNLHDLVDSLKLKELIEWLSGGPDLLSTSQTMCTIRISGPDIDSRRRFFFSVVQCMPMLPARIYEARYKVLTSRAQRLTVDELSPSAKCDDGARNNGLVAAYNLNGRDDGTRIGSVDRDHQCLREQRTFFRAAITELLKENKFKVFCRPVDPEAVPDYYDVVKRPMDLETMRMKVDSQLYPTLQHFMRDIDQIVFNAKAYNPMTRDDHRGRSIVHSAHGMLDLVESHAYNFRKEIGYDLFGQCKVLAQRNRTPPPLPPPNMNEVDARLTPADLIFYQDVLSTHATLKLQRQEAVEEGSDEGKNLGIVNERPGRVGEFHSPKSCGSFKNRSWSYEEKGNDIEGAEGPLASQSLPARATRSSATLDLSIQQLGEELDAARPSRKRRRNIDSEVNCNDMDAEDRHRVDGPDKAEGDQDGEVPDHVDLRNSPAAAHPYQVAGDTESAVEPALRLSGNSAEAAVHVESVIKPPAPKLSPDDIANCPLLKSLLVSMQQSATV
jgi:hypothetical protein